MKLLNAVMIFVAILINSLMAQYVFAQDEKNEISRLVMGYSIKTLYDIDIKDAIAAIEVWNKEIGGMEGASVKSFFYDDARLLIKDMQNGIVDNGVFYSEDYLLVKKELAFEQIVTRLRGGKKTERFLVLVRDDSGISDISDLKGKVLSISKWDNLGLIYLTSELLKKGLLPPEKHFSDIATRDKISKTVLSVFFGQSDACIVPDVSFHTVSELNPQIGKQLRAISVSPEVIMGFSVFRNDYPEKSKADVTEKMLNLESSFRGRQILMLYKSDGFATVNETEMETINNLLVEYEELSGHMR